MNRPAGIQTGPDAFVPFLTSFKCRHLPWRRHPVASAWRWSRAVLFQPPLLAGLLLWLSFPPVDWSYLAWFALTPLAVLIRARWQSAASAAAAPTASTPSSPHGKLRSIPIYQQAWVGGILFGLLAVQWIRYADDSGLTGYYGWWALAFYMSLYFPLFLLVARMAVLRFRAPIFLAVPAVWVGLEYLRSWLITGFPWYYLGHTQYNSTRLIQIADCTGAYGVSFVVALVNGWMVDLVALPLVRPTAQGSRIEPRQLWRLGVLVAVIAGSLNYGAWRLRQAEKTPGPRVAIMQSSIPQKVKEDEDRIPEVHQGYWRQLAEAIPQKPRLIIWPETAYRYPLPIIAPDVSDEELASMIPNDEIEPKEIREFAHHVRNNLRAFAERSGVPNLMGINTEVFERTGSSRFNSAYLTYPGGEMSGPYNKMTLVPWGEYLPLRNWMPWLRVFTPHASADYGLTAGDKPVRFRLDDLTFGVLTCFEDTVPSAARAYVATEPVDFLVNISNDGWFGVVRPGEVEASLWRRAEHDVHMAISVFRAVECRRPLVRAVNTGVSAIVDSSGRIVSSSALAADKSRLASQVIVGDLPLDRRQSIYSRTGDWLGVTTFTLTALTCLAAFGTAFYRRRVKDN